MFNIINRSKEAEVISAKSLLLIVGILGFALPILLIIFSVALEQCEVVQKSISVYYYTISRNLLVGTICAIALCFIVYKGYSKIDGMAGNLAAIFALGVAFFPTAVSAPLTKCVNSEVHNGIIGEIHFISAALLFLILAFFSLVLFTKSDPQKEISKLKKRKNVVFRICGYLILLFVLLIFVYFQFLQKRFPDLEKWHPVFWLETLSLWAFSISWLTKSEVYLKKNKAAVTDK